MITRIIASCVCSLLFATIARAVVPTAEEYAHSLESSFTNGVSAGSVRESFVTNGIYTIYDVLPFCYDFTVDTNDLEGSVSRYKAKLAFIETIMPQGYFEFPSNIIERTSKKLSREHGKMVRSIRARIADNPTPEAKEHWSLIYPRAVSGAHSGRADIALALRDTRLFTRTLDSFITRFMFIRPQYSFNYVLNIDIYTNIFSRAELYAELSTNTQYNADAMFKYCLTEKSVFATNNIAIAEKQIWRNNFVLEITTHSCNLHTNAANRALNDAYTNRLAMIRAHYDAIPEPHLGMSGAELDEWRNRLGNTIDAYTGNISPFR